MVFMWKRDIKERIIRRLKARFSWKDMRRVQETHGWFRQWAWVVRVFTVEVPFIGIVLVLTDQNGFLCQKVVITPKSSFSRETVPSRSTARWWSFLQSPFPTVLSVFLWKICVQKESSSSKIWKRSGRSIKRSKKNRAAFSTATNRWTMRIWNV